MWKNNTYLLANPEYREAISSKLSEFFSLNSPSTQNSFTTWNAHKAYIRGMLIQASARWKKDRNKTLNNLFHSIKLLENRLKLCPSVALHKDLLDARLKLCQMNEFETQLNKSKVTHYNLINKPSKLMYRRVAAVRHKTKIPFLLSHAQKHKLSHPQEISN